MDYRMFSEGCPAGKDVVTLIRKSLKEQGITLTTPLRFVGFEGAPGTTFTLNNHKEKTKIPSSGAFITPFNGDKGMNIYKLVFDSSFSGDIYYIV